MPDLFIYLVKVNVALLVFCAGYFLVLRRLTFYTLNRIYLVTAILFATLYPRVDLSNFLQNHEQLSKPMQVVILNWQAPVKDLATQHDKWYWMQLIFWVGVVLFAIRLGMQLVSLYCLHKRSQPIQIQHYLVRSIKGDVNPFSFWRSIYVNPENHEPQDLKAILEHEQIHVNEWHTLDILLGEISTVFYWFNPGIWLMKRAIKENIEFITDRKILQKGMDSKAYQYSLLNVNFGAESNAIVNNFNISTIKKRIMMMNARRSSKLNVTRYLVLVPVVIMLLLVFSVSKAELTRHITKTSNAVVGAINSAVGDLNELLPEHKNIDTNKTKTDRTIPLAKKTVIDTNKHKFTIVVKDTLRKSNLDDIDLYINDKKVDRKLLSTINPEEIKSINVLKDGNSSNPNGTIYVYLKGYDAKLKTDSSAKVMLMKLGQSTQNESVTITAHSARQNGNHDTLVMHGNRIFATGKPLVFKTDTGHFMAKQLNGKGWVNTYSTTFTTDSANAFKSHNKFNIVGVVNVPNNTPIKFDDKLIIINGKEATPKKLKKISAADIERIEVLKGIAAQAKYGDKGNNGVIIITTK